MSSAIVLAQRFTLPDALAISAHGVVLVVDGAQHFLGILESLTAGRSPSACLPGSQSVLQSSARGRLLLRMDLSSDVRCSYSAP